MLVRRTLVIIALSIATAALASPHSDNGNNGQNQVPGHRPGGGDHGRGPQQGRPQQAGNRGHGGGPEQGRSKQGGNLKQGYTQQGNPSQGNHGDPGKGPSGDSTETAMRIGPSRRAVPVQRDRRRALNSMDAAEIATQICPNGLYGCPIADAGSLKCLPATLVEWVAQGFECVDVKADLRACGGCASLDAKYDCTMIANAQDVSCVSGACVVNSCLPSFKLNRNNNSWTSTRDPGDPETVSLTLD